jgi:anti-sigma B factor antagonist
MFEIWREADGTVKMSGRLDAAMADRAREVFAGIAEGCTVDLRALEYISSAGLGVLIATQKRLGGNRQKIVLAHPNRHIRELFGIAGLDHVFEIVES